MRGVLEEIGFADALLAYDPGDGGLTLVDGHLRAGLDPEAEVPVLILDLDQEEADKLLLTLDPLATLAAPDGDALRALIDDTQFSEPDLQDLMRDLAKLAGPAGPKGGHTEPDAVPPVPAESWVKRGDVFALGGHVIACGEAPHDVALLGDCSGALVLTDPPYGIGIVKNQRVRQPGGRRVGTLGGGDEDGRRLARLTGKPQEGREVKPRLYYPVQGDDRPFDPTWLLSCGTAQIIWGAPYFASLLRDGTSWIAWDKGMGEDATFSGFEAAWTSFAGRFRLYRHRWSGMVRAGSRAEELKDRVHPTQKPVGLFAAILEDFPEFSLVVDPYLGSGTTLIAAERLGRVCYGMEIEPRYVQVVLERWEAYTGRKAVKAPKGRARSR